MLGLRRREKERVRILLPDGQVIWVALLEIDRMSVRLGFEAPADVRIEREEIIRFREEQERETP